MSTEIHGCQKCNLLVMADVFRHTGRNTPEGVQCFQEDLESTSDIHAATVRFFKRHPFVASYLGLI